MTPEHALIEDWPLYYTDTLMLHKGIEVVYITVTDGRLFYVTADAPKTMRQANPMDLSPYFPLDGAYNTPDGALFLEFTRNGNAKRSTTPESIRIKWSSQKHVLLKTLTLLKIITQGQQYIPYHQAMQLLDDGVKNAVAIHPDIILQSMGANRKGEYRILFKGEYTGILNSNVFVADWEGLPSCKRLRIRLKQEGII